MSKGGEIFVPKIPSYKIMDLVKAISTNSKVKFIGKRSGEKIHEEMITETDSLNTYEYKDYFVIASDFNLNNPGDFNLSKTLQLNGGKKCKRGFNYSSKNNMKFLSISEIKKLIQTIK